VESSRYLGAADLYRREYILLRILGYNHLTVLRAGTRAIINLIPLFVVFYFSTFADLLGVTLSTFRQVYRSAGVMAVMLTIFYLLVIIVSQPSFLLDLPQNKFVVIINSLLATFLH